jgi:predicted DNA-binding transcriptional regulator AlpA
MQDDDLLDLVAVCRFLGGSRPINPSTFYRGIKAGRYAKGIKVGPKSVRWSRSKLIEDLERMQAAEAVS